MNTYTYAVRLRLDATEYTEDDRLMSLSATLTLDAEDEEKPWTLVTRGRITHHKTRKSAQVTFRRLAAARFAELAATAPTHRLPGEQVLPLEGTAR